MEDVQSSSDDLGPPSPRIAKPPKSSFKGVLFATLAAIATAGSIIMLKRCHYLSASEQSAVRYLVQILFLAAYRRLYNRRHAGKLAAEALADKRLMMLVRGAIGTLGYLLLIVAVKLVSPSDAMAIFNCKILVTAVAGRLFLGEKFTLAIVLALAAAVAGFLLISQPSFVKQWLAGNVATTALNVTQNGCGINCLRTQNTTLVVGTFYAEYVAPNVQLIGVTVALLAAMCSALVYVLIKKLCNLHVHVSTITLYTAYVGFPSMVALSALTYAVAGSNRPALSSMATSELVAQVAWTLTGSLFAVLSQVFVGFGIKHEDATKVAVIGSSEMLLIFVFQKVFLGIPSNLFSIIGAMLIFASACLVMVHKLFDHRYAAKYDGFLTKTPVDVNGVKHKEPNVLQRIVFFKF